MWCTTNSSSSMVLTMKTNLESVATTLGKDRGLVSPFNDLESKINKESLSFKTISDSVLFCKGGDPDRVDSINAGIVPIRSKSDVVGFKTKCEFKDDVEELVVKDKGPHADSFGLDASLGDRETLQLDLQKFLRETFFHTDNIVEFDEQRRNDCWKKAFFLDQGNSPLTLNELLNLLELCIENTLGPTCRDLPKCEMKAEDGCCYICFEYDCDCEFDEELISPFDQALQDYRIKMVLCSDGLLHFEGYRWHSSSDQNCPSDEGWFKLQELLSIREITKQIATTHGGKEIDLFDFLLVGSAMDIIDESKRVNATEIGKLQALQSFNDDFASLPKTKFRLATSELRRIARYLGFQVMSQNKIRNSNDHVWLEVAREFLREELDSRFPHNEDFSKVLHVGATTQEIKRWYSHVGHHFFLCLKEDKDFARITEDAIRLVGNRLASMTIPALTSRKGNATSLSIDDISELFRLYEKGNHKRIHLTFPKQPYSVLFFEDCLYDMTPEEFAEYWQATGAAVGYAIMFFPDNMLGEFALSSEIYDYEEYYSPVMNVEEIIERIWPSILLLQPLLPLPDLAEGAHKLIKWCFTNGWETFKSFLKNVAHDDYPFEVIFGVGFDLAKLGPIYRHLLQQLKPIFRRELARIRISWRGGFSNGYDHPVKTWEYWHHTRRIPLPNGQFVDSEVVSTKGEMKLMRFWRSSGASPISYSLELPLERTAVLVADIPEAFNPGTYKVFGLNKLKYFPVNSKDWYVLFNWAMAEPLESLSFGVMMTTLNRIRGGLSLSSNVLVEEMDIRDDQVRKIALACLMEVYKEHQIVQAIEDDPEIHKSYQSNAKMLVKEVGKVAFTVLTGGLGVPLYFLFKWMMTTNLTLEFVKYPVKPKAITVRGKTGTSKIPKVLSTSLEMVLPHKEQKKKFKCELCGLCQSGKFSESGDFKDGQLFICENSDCVNEHDLSFNSEQVTELITKARNAEADHTAMGATRIVPVIKKFKHWLEANQGGIEHKAQLHFITGGPGTGKSEVIKVLMNEYEISGQSAGVLMPFSDLQADYIDTLVIGEKKKKTFSANTTWYGASWTKLDVLLIDEVSAVDWSLVKGLAAYTGAYKIFLVGDDRQTSLNSAAGEGIDPLNPSSGIDWERVPKHELVKNFRLDAWRVKMLNKQFGYRMLPVRSDQLPPKFIPKSEYDSMKTQGVGAEREFVFAHESALDIFGAESKAGSKEVPNMSVRSAQGKTIKGTAAVSATQMDYPLLSVKGQVNVSVSRSKGQVYYVYKEDQGGLDPVVVKLKEMLWVSNPEQIQQIIDDALPELPEPKLERTMTPEERNLENYLLEKAAFGRMEPLVEPGEEDAFVTGLDPNQKIEFDLGILNNFTTENFNLLGFYRSMFQMCFIEVVLEKFSDPETVEKVLKFLGKIYSDDVLMHRAKISKTSKIISLFAGVTPLVKLDGKYLLPLKETLRFVESEITPVMLWKTGRLIHVSKAVRQSGKIPLLLECDKNHIISREEQQLEVLVQGVDHPVPLEETYVFSNRLTFAEVIQSLKDGKLQQINMPPELKWVSKLKKFELELGLMDSESNSESEEDFPDVPNTPVGYKPTFSRVTLPEMSRKHHNLFMEHQPLTSSWKQEEVPVKQPIIRNTKLRLGTDAFKLAKFIDPSAAWKNYSALNVFGPIKGPTIKTSVKINWDGFIHQRTKMGKIRKTRPTFYRSINPGMGNHYNNTPVESLLAAQRVGRQERKPPLTAESKAYAITIARDVYNNFWRKDYVMNKEVVNWRIEEAMKDAKTRNYDGRSDAENRKSFTPTLTCSNKDQFKPIKNQKLNLMKYGQVLLQSPASVNLQFMAWMRTQGYMFKQAMKEDIFTDDYETNSEFRKRFTQAVARLPAGVSVGIADGEEWDSQQNSVTLEIEKELCRLFKATDRTIEEYFHIRGNLPFIMYGIFKGRTNGEKGSGFLDTKLGNTKLQSALASRIIKGLGPRVVGVKGDDYAVIQCGLSVDEHERKKISALCGMKINIDIGKGGEFCGNSISRAGMYPSITRAAMKAVAIKSRNYEQFCAQQQSWRDLIEEYQDCGLEETVAFSAHAEGVNINYVRACLEFLNSMSHISRKQWEQITTVRSNFKYQLPTASGPTIL